MICPICKKPANDSARPFCSRRCADVDLGRWLTESYRIPDQSGEPLSAEEEAQVLRATKETDSAE